MSHLSHRRGCKCSDCDCPPPSKKCDCPIPSALSVFRSTGGGENSIAVGDPIVFDVIQHLSGAAITYAPAAGLVTFNEAGAFKITYGLTTAGSIGAAATDVAATFPAPPITPLPAGRFTADPQLGQVKFFGVSFTLTAVVGQKLDIRNLGPAALVLDGTAGDKQRAFLVVEQIL